MAYLLDANIFIQPHRSFYNSSIAPGFWDWLSIQLRSGKSASIDNVLTELKAGNDGLKEWAILHTGHFLTPGHEPNLMGALGTVAQWVQSQDHYTESAKNEFLNVADYFLCAYALAGEHTIVTQETANPNSKKRILIPIVCIELGIPYKGLYDYMKLEQARLILDDL